MFKLTDFIGKEFQIKNVWQCSVLHECFTITYKDHAT